MTTETIQSQTATEAEIAAAAQEAIEAFKRDRVQTGQEISGATEVGSIRPMTYRIPNADAAAWVMVWELQLDADGQEYGTPTRAPRGQLGLWLQKRRDDGGMRFTVQQPARIAMEPQFPCLRQGCSKRLYTRQDMVDHVENTHPREARLYRAMLDEILAKAAEDNPRVAEIAHTIANMRELGVRSMPVSEPVQQELDLDVNLGKPIVSSFGIKKPEPVADVVQPTTDIPVFFRCRKDGCQRFFDSDNGRAVHEANPKLHRG